MVHFRNMPLTACLMAICALASPLVAQDPGAPDTVRIGTIAGDVYSSLSVPVTLCNDEPLLSVVIPVVIDGYSGWMRFDSISYIDGRLENASILPERESFVYVTDTFRVEAFVIRFSVSSGEPLPAGDGKLLDIWFTPVFGGDVALDTISFSPYGNLRLSDEAMNDFLPQFQFGTGQIACTYEIGDTRNDGGVNIGDWMGLWKQYFGCQEALAPSYVSDVNCDRRVDMRDVKAIWDYVYSGGDICVCGSYSPAAYNDPGAPDTLWIESDTLYVGVWDTIDVRMVHDEPLSCYSVGLHWDGSAILDLSTDFNYTGGYLCVHYDGNPGYVCPYGVQKFDDDYIPGDTVIAKLPFMALNEGTTSITMEDLPTGPGSIYVTSSGDAVVPVSVGGGITVLPRLCGDVNGDGDINVADVVYLVNFIFKGGPPPQPLSAGDADGDCALNIGDPVHLINYVFKGGDPPICNDECVW
jgi:hypothetical protein